MLLAVRRLISPPELPDPEAAGVAAAIHTIGLYLGGAAAVWTVVSPFVTPDPWAGVGLCLLAIVLCGVSIALARCGRVQEGSFMLVGMIWTVSALAIIYGGLASPAFSAFIIAIVLAGLLTGTRGAITVSVMSAGFGGIVGILELNSLLPPVVLEQTMMTKWGIEVTLFGAAAGVVAIYLRRILSAEHALSESREQLLQSQKMEALGRLAGGVAHDFNNLLTAISGYGHVVLRDLGTPRSRRDDVLEILRAADRGADLTKQLLAFGRREAIQPIVLELNTIVSEMQLLIRQLIEENVEVEILLASNLGRILADRGQIEQVLMNLVVNARDAMPNGGRLTIQTGNLEIDFTTSDRGDLPPGPYVSLTVRDSGVGMDAATQSRLFEPFFTTKERGQGSGLGLAILYGIVQQCGGDVRVVLQEGSRSKAKAEAEGLIVIPGGEASA